MTESTPESAGTDTRMHHPRRWRANLAAAAGLVLVGVVVVLAMTTTPEAQIRETISDFSAAADVNDGPAMARLLCAQEVGAVTEDDDYDPTPTTRLGLGTPIVTGIRIDEAGTGATADITFPGRPLITVSLAKHDNQWTLCNPTGS